MKSREVHLVRRPEGMPKPGDFALVDAPVREPGEGEVEVQNLFMSVDPYMRPRLSAGQALNEVLGGDSIGRVIKTRDPKFNEGDLVQSRYGFREAYVAKASEVTKLTPDPAIPLTAYMHVLGMTGFTAYGGLLHIGQLKDGETVFVSTAAGAVGSAVAQIAKIKGSTVIGSTGAAEKAGWLKTLGVDHVINYKQHSIRAALGEIDKRIDVYFDNVGGETLEAALGRMNLLGRVAVCGMISGYNGQGAPVSNLASIIYGRINIRGFTGADYPQLMGKFREDMTAWVKAGRVKYQETFHNGIDQAPAAMIGLMQGENIGKMLVKLAA